MNTNVIDFRRPLADTTVAINVLHHGLDSFKTMTVEAFSNAWERYLEGKGACPNLYQPVVMQAVSEIKGQIVVAGQPARCKGKPDNWPDDLEFTTGDKLISARMHHAKDVRKLCDPDSIVTKDGVDYVLGIHSINASQTGNYGSIIACGKRLAFANVNGVERLVGKIHNDSEIEYFEDGSWILWGANQRVTWGTLNKDGLVLTYDEIRKQDKMEFVALIEPIVGNDVTVDNLIQAVQTEMESKDSKEQTSWNRFCGGDIEVGKKKTWDNVHTLCRLHPKAVFCFGFRSVQVGIPCFTRYAGNTVENSEEVMSFVIGQRLPMELSENCWEMKRRLKAVEKEEVETVEVETVESVSIA